MSIDFRNDVLALQRMTKALGQYPGALDGQWGPQTERAYQWFSLESDKIAQKYGRFDLRSETNIVTLIPPAQAHARWVLVVAKHLGLNARIISGTRSYSEQTALYNQGRTLATRTMPIVTNAKAGQSNHNFLLAWDIGLFSASGDYLEASGPYLAFAHKIAAACKQVGFSTLDIGAFWPGFADPPHYGLRSNYEDRNKREPLEEVRKRYEQGLRWW